MPVCRGERGTGVWPTTIDELEPAERLVVLSLRYFVFARSGRPRHPRGRPLGEPFANLGDGDGELALALLSQLVGCLQRHARRRFSLHAPCHPGLGMDEACVVRLVAACQHRQPHLARALARWMVKPSVGDELMEASIGFARILRRNALALPLRVAAPPPGPTPTWPHAQSATVH